MDVKMNGMDGLMALRCILLRHPDAKVVMYLSLKQEALEAPAKAAGVRLSPEAVHARGDPARPRRAPLGVFSSCRSGLVSDSLSGLPPPDCGAAILSVRTEYARREKEKREGKERRKERRENKWKKDGSECADFVHACAALRARALDCEAAVLHLDPLRTYDLSVHLTPHASSLHHGD